MTIDVLKTLPNDSKCVNGTVPVRQSVRRSLFGKVDHDELSQFLTKQMDAINESQKKKWNFDFVEERPLEPCNYEWTPIQPNESIPRPYALSRLPYLHEHTENTIPCDQSSCLPDSRSQVTLSNIKLQQTLIDGYIKTKKRPGAVISKSETCQNNKFNMCDLEPSNKKICLMPEKTQK